MNSSYLDGHRVQFHRGGQAQQTLGAFRAEAPGILLFQPRPGGRSQADRNEAKRTDSEGRPQVLPGGHDCILGYRLRAGSHRGAPGSNGGLWGDSSPPQTQRQLGRAEEAPPKPAALVTAPHSCHGQHRSRLPVHMHARTHTHPSLHR